VIVCCVVAYFFASRSIKDPQAKRIAFFVPATHPAMDEIEQGFRTTLAGLDPDSAYEYTVFNANGNKTVQRAQAEEIAIGSFDLIVTVGVGCSKMVQEITTKKGLLTPIVFTAVDDPVQLGLVADLHASGNHVTGIVERPNYEKQMSELMRVKPSARHMLLVYDPAHGTGLEKDKQQIAALAQKHGIKFSAVEIFASNEIHQKVPSLIEDVDVIMILPDHTVVAAIDSLIKLCNQRGITLYASDTGSGQKGAALAFGVQEYDFGAYAARSAYVIVHDHRNPATVPVVPVDNHALHINKDTAVQQGLNVEAL